MGSTTAMGYKDMVDREWLSMYQAMKIHLTGNHYPPIPTSMIEPCMEAVEAGNDRDWDREIELPEGILYKNEFETAPASAIIEAHHLEWFLEPDEEW